ncbi:AtpZ/AtpI family protein [Niabella insulamsoli]|uniref:AtpZ/AtpI family protein n=1 Tax=Niabella insulamsoli TaxID=3144874 RepID=UPI0031FCF68D
MDPKNYSPWLRYLGVSAQLLVLIALSVFAGIKLDAKFSISPLLTVALPLLILAAAFYKLIKETGKKNKK